MHRKRYFIGGTALFLLALLLPVTSFAQALVVSPLMGEKLKEETDLGFAVFASLDVGVTPYTMTYEGKNLAEVVTDGNTSGSKGTSKYIEKSQRMYAIGATFGVHWAVLNRLIISGGMGASYLQLQDAEPNHSDYAFDLVPSPGFSAFLGMSWEPISTNFISGIIGLQMSYLSTFGLSGSSFKNTEESSSGVTTTEEDIRVTDTEMHLINIQPYVGFQWRPVSTFVTNSFGLYYAGMISLANMTQETKAYESSETGFGGLTEDGTRDKKKIDLWVKPLQPLGAYYGWYFSIPHAGTVGIEVQIGNRWNGALSYQYRF